MLSRGMVQIERFYPKVYRVPNRARRTPETLPCYSGVLCHPTHPQQRLIRRLALVTEKALNFLESNEQVQQRLEEAANNYEKFAEILLQEERLDIEAFECQEKNWCAFGIRLFQPGEEIEIYEKAKDEIRDPAPGNNRRIFFGIMGVATPKKLAALPTNLYAALLAKIRDKYQDPELRRIVRIAFTKGASDRVRQNPNGKMEITLSLPLLKEYERWAHIESF